MRMKMRRVNDSLFGKVTSKLTASEIAAVPFQKPFKNGPDDELMSFLEAFRKALPRELRDMVYKYILHNLNASEVQSINSIVNPSRTIEGKYVVKCSSKIPRPLVINLCGRDFVNEMIHVVYQESDIIYVPYSTQLEAYLNFDAFGHGIPPRDCTLSKLRVGIDLLWFRSLRRRATLIKEFSHLLRPEQKLARGFQLALELKYLSFVASWMEAEVFVFVLQALKSITERVKEKCQGKVRILFQGLEITEQQMDWDDDAWVAFLKTSRTVL